MDRAQIYSCIDSDLAAMEPEEDLASCLYKIHGALHHAQLDHFGENTGGWIVWVQRIAALAVGALERFPGPTDDSIDLPDKLLDQDFE